MKKIISLALIAIFSVTLFSAKENDKTKPKIDLEKYAKLKNTIVNDLNNVTEIALQIQEEKGIDSREALIVALKLIYVNDFKALNAFNSSSQSTYNNNPIKNFNSKQQKIVNQINTKLVSFDKLVGSKNYLSTKLEDIVVNNKLSVNDKNDLLEHITILTASLNFMINEGYEDFPLAPTCQEMGGFEVYYSKPCPLPSYQIAAQTQSNWFRCCKYPQWHRSLTNLASTIRSRLGKSEIIGLIYGTIIESIET
jgi:hypothetical protein